MINQNQSMYILLQCTSLSIKASTAAPALTSNMTRRGFFRLATISSIDFAPIILVPFASFCMKLSTLDTVMLYATTCKIYIIYHETLHVLPQTTPSNSIHNSIMPTMAVQVKLFKIVIAC